jgi:glycerophosphoryl diester phosphodiesterase
MWDKIRVVVVDAFGDLRSSWKSLAITDIAYKVVAFALLAPATALLLRWMASTSDAHARVVADADIARFFLTTRVGVAILILGGAILVAITALEMGCLMAIGLAGASGTRLDAKSALAFGAKRAPFVLALTGHMVVRLLLGSLPFLAALGVVYVALLRPYDINFYLAQRPPVFYVAAAIGGVIVAALAALLVWTIARWALALPLVLFEGVLPRRAFREGARRSAGNRWVVLAVLAAWAIVAVVLANVARWLPELLAASVARHLAGSLTALLLFVAVLAFVWAVIALAVAIVNASLFALAIVRLYLRIGAPQQPRVPEPVSLGGLRGPVRLSKPVIAGVAAIVVLAFVGFALLAFMVTRSNRPVAVIAHRGSSAAAPENSLAAFRLATEQGADFVELDVQETADGEVLVVHDSDLMKIGGGPAKIWEATAAELRSVDIGSRKGPQFAAERVPTLAEALAVCKGKSRVIVELKSYGHDQRLQERVAAIVEAAGMADDCIFMSMDHTMIGRMKRLRPSWRCGILTAKSVGDLTKLEADFLAVEARMATGRFVRRAHRAGRDVYVWTVNDPAWMLATMSRGVDGLITDKPDLARVVVARRAGLSDAQRFGLALLVRVGAHEDLLDAEGNLRP